MRLTAKVALITGGSRGIGRGIALCLAEEGADVVVNYRTHPQEAEEVASEIRQMGRRSIVWQADTSDRKQIEGMIEGAAERLGSLDIVVANAAYSVRRPVVETKPEELERIFAVSQLGVFYTCQLAARRMMAQGQPGKLLIISSIHAEMAVANSAPYNMAKIAINMLAATLSRELAPHRINVNAINPGWIDTPGERAYSSEQQLANGARRLPWKRLGTPRDIGRAAVFLVSDDADYITGTVLRVDGGFIVGLTLPEM
jgi:glucose 1-dehydrogenase